MFTGETIEKAEAQYTVYFAPELEPYPWLVDRRENEELQCGIAHCKTLAEARRWVESN